MGIKPRQRIKPIFIMITTIYSHYHFHVELFQFKDQAPDKGPDQDINIKLDQD